MKIKKLFFAALAVVTALSVQSCLKEDGEVFQQSSSERLQAYIENVQNVLVSQENGWIMEYYPGSGQSRGGYAFYVKFTDTEVTAACELDPELQVTTPYKMTTDNSAVLSFDVFNEVLHYFATPSSGEYEAKGGDFEFSIVSADAEMVDMVGKRSGNHCKLVPYTSEKPVAEYLEDVVDMGESMRAAIISGSVGETQVDGTINFNARRITFNWMEGDEQKVAEAPYMYTTEGLRLYKEVKVAGATLYNLYYLSDNNILTNGSVEFVGKLPEDYAAYADFAGDFTLVAYGGQIKWDVTLTPNEDASGYILSGLMPQFTVNLPYDRAQGRLNWEVQVVGTEGSTTVWLAAWSLIAGGNLTWDTSVPYGMTIHKDLETGNFVFEDNGKSDMTIDSFILWGTTSEGASTGQFTAWNKANGDNQFPYLESLIRK